MREAAAVAKINFVGVKLKNLLLGEAVLELQRHHGLGDFAPQGPVRIEKEAARHLHRNRAAALHARAVAQVRPGRSENAYGIEARMLEEAPVFHRKHGVTQNLGNVVVADGAALLARTVEEAGQQFRFHIRRIDCRARIHRANLLNIRAAEIHHQAVFSAEI